MLTSLLAISPSPWFQPFVWLDSRVSVLFTVIIPLVLLIWAFVQKAEHLLRLLIIYLRVASLFVINIYLMIAALPISFISAFSVHLLIPLSLWFWIDINEEINDRASSALKLVFTAWRWAITVYSGIALLGQLFFLKCGFLGTPQLLEDGTCRVWLDPAWGYKEMFHSHSNVPFLGFLGLASLLIYVLYLGYFALFRLGKSGRIAAGN
jgi:hypothetical protein